MHCLSHSGYRLQHPNSALQFEVACQACRYRWNCEIAKDCIGLRGRFTESNCKMWVKVRPKGEGLVSSLHRNSKGEPSALVSSTDTSRHHDKVPVLAHRGRTTCKQEALFPCTILPCVAMQEPDEAQAGVCANRLSLWAGAHIHYARSNTTGCLSALYLFFSGGRKPEMRQTPLPSRPIRTRHSSPWLEARGLLPRDVEVQSLVHL
jgi:hypothetical protein